MMGAYERAILRVIPLAEEIAFSRAGQMPSVIAERDAWRDRWDRAYHRAMDELACAMGIRRQSWQGSTPERGALH